MPKASGHKVSVSERSKKRRRSKNLKRKTMYRYYDLMAIILGGILIVSGLGAVVAGTYIPALAMIGAGGAAMAYSKQLKRKEDKQVLLEESPISASTPRLEDKQIIKRIAQAKFDPVNFQLKDIEKGSILEYNTDTWTVQDMRYLYWTDADGSDRDQITKRATIGTGENQFVVQVAQDKSNAMVPVTKEVNPFMIDPKMQTYINLKEFDPPPVLNFKGENYYRESRRKGYSIERKHFTYTDVQSYEYFNENKSSIIRLNYFGDKKIKAEIGTLEKDIRFSNILPSPDGDDRLLISD